MIRYDAGSAEIFINRNRIPAMVRPVEPLAGQELHSPIEYKAEIVFGLEPKKENEP